MTPDQITVYVGLGVIVFGTVIWATKTSPMEENTIEVFGIKFKLNTPAIAVMAIGVVLVVVGGWLLPSKAPLSNSELDHVSTAAQKPASGTEQNRQEQVEIDRLASAKFDEADLRTLSLEAKTPKVQAEAQRRLNVIATEKKSYEAVKDDIVGLTELLSKSCEACLVQGAARAQLIKLKEDQAAQEEDVIAAEKNKAQAPANTKPDTSGDDHTELSIVPWHNAYAVHTASNRLHQFVFFYCRDPAGQRLLAITLSHGSTPKPRNDGASLESIARTSAFEVSDASGRATLVRPKLMSARTYIDRGENKTDVVFKFDEAEWRVLQMSSRFGPRSRQADGYLRAAERLEFRISGDRRLFDRIGGACIK